MSVWVTLSNGQDAVMPCPLHSGVVEEEIANVAALVQSEWSVDAALRECVSSADLQSQISSLMLEVFIRIRDVQRGISRDMFERVLGDVPFDL